MKLIKSHRELEVYQLSFETAMEIYKLTNSFQNEEKYSLTDQIRRSSRSVCANLTEAWRKRIYKAAFITKISDCEAEACETQTWLDFSKSCGYIDDKVYAKMDTNYNNIIGKLVNMRTYPEKWTIN